MKGISSVMPMRHVLLSTLAALGLLGPELAAQENPAEGLQDLLQTLNQPISAASKRLQRLKEAPADATVITGMELADLGYRTLGEALGGVLGFRTNRDRAYEGLGVRGLYVLGDQNTRVLVLLEGHALNSPAEVGSSKVGEDFGISLDLVERIEVVRGPASSLYGNNAFLGMVNVVLREPPTGRPSGEFLASANSRDLGSVDAMAGGELGKSRWQVILSGMQRKGSEMRLPELSPGPLPADLDREERQSACLRLKGEGWSLLGFAGSRTQGISSAPFLSAVGDPLNRYRNRMLFGEARYEPVLGGVETLLRVYGDRNEYGSVLQYTGGQDPRLEGLFTEVDPNRNLGGEVQARVRFGDFLVTGGGEQSWHHFDGRTGIAPDFISTQVRYEMANRYLQVEWTPVEVFTAVAGLQQAEFHIRSAQSDAGGAVTPMDHAPLRGTTPRLALIWRPTALDIVKVLYGGGYRNPTIFERYYGDGSSFLPNPALGSERIDTGQGIWVRVWDWGFQSQVAYSRSRWQNQIESADPGGGFQQFQNTPQEIRGSALEAELKGRWPGWECYLQAGVYRWEREGVSLPNVAPLQVAARIVRRWGAWSASTEVRHVGLREDPGTAATAPAATTLRLALRWQSPHFWVRSVLEDAGHARRIDLVAQDYAPITRVESDGRTLLLTAGWRF